MTKYNVNRTNYQFITLIGCILIYSICEVIYDYLYYKYYYNTIHNQSINNNDTVQLIN